MPRSTCLFAFCRLLRFCPFGLRLRVAVVTVYYVTVGAVRYRCVAALPRLRSFAHRCRCYVLIARARTLRYVAVCHAALHTLPRFGSLFAAYTAGATLHVAVTRLRILPPFCRVATFADHCCRQLHAFAPPFLLRYVGCAHLRICAALVTAARLLRLDRCCVTLLLPLRLPLFAVAFAAHVACVRCGRFYGYAVYRCVRYRSVAYHRSARYLQHLRLFNVRFVCVLRFAVCTFVGSSPAHRTFAICVYAFAVLRTPLPYAHTVAARAHHRCAYTLPASFGFCLLLHAYAVRVSAYHGLIPVRYRFCSDYRLRTRCVHLRSFAMLRTFMFVPCGFAPLRSFVGYRTLIGCTTTYVYAGFTHSLRIVLRLDHVHLLRVLRCAISVVRYYLCLPCPTLPLLRWLACTRTAHCCARCTRYRCYADHAGYVFAIDARARYVHRSHTHFVWVTFTFTFTVSAGSLHFRSHRARHLRIVYAVTFARFALLTTPHCRCDLPRRSFDRLYHFGCRLPRLPHYTTARVAFALFVTAFTVRSGSPPSLLPHPHHVVRCCRIVHVRLPHALPHVLRYAHLFVVPRRCLLRCVVRAGYVYYRRAMFTLPLRTFCRCVYAALLHSHAVRIVAPLRCLSLRTIFCIRVAVVSLRSLPRFTFPLFCRYRIS